MSDNEREPAIRGILHGPIKNVQWWPVDSEGMPEGGPVDLSKYIQQEPEAAPLQGEETDPCPDCTHWRAHHGTYGCSACKCQRWVL